MLSISMYRDIEISEKQIESDRIKDAKSALSGVRILLYILKVRKH